ncbi:MAG: DUF4252 domain-containing protein [Terriglobales bacterium]|jgi:hypothetical protein
MKRPLAFFFAWLIVILAAGVVEAQQSSQDVPLTAAPPQQQQEQRGWIPQGIQGLRQSAASKTEFTLDHSMLVIASKLSPDNEDLQRVIAGVSGVSVHSFRYSGRWTYDPEALGALKEEYRTAGWTQLVNNHDKDGASGGMNVWIRWENNAISNVAILSARANEVDFFVVTGSISPIDLSHLGGHFGIPKLDGGVVVPRGPGRP